MKVFRFLTFILVAQLSFGALGQQPKPAPTPPPQTPPATQPAETSDQEDVVRITTNLVQVDAVVTDSKGDLVTDLKPEEVEIYEDGHQQKITHFSFNASEATPAASKPPDKNAPLVPPTRLRREDVRRTIALVVDDLGLSFESTYYVRRALKKFVDEQMQPGDLVAIVRTSSGMGALQQFTADKRQLYAAIDRVKYYMNGRTGISAFAPIEPPTPGPSGEAVDQAKQELDDFREEVFAVGTLGAVSYVVSGLRELPGRKSILLLSDGFSLFNPHDPTRNTRTLERLRRLIDEAGRASVVIYTMNASGLQTLGFTAADDTGGRSPQQIGEQLSARSEKAFLTQEGLDVLALETGGMAIKNTNDISGGIRRVLNDQKGYYLIGYRPDKSTFDLKTGRRQFHNLSLKIKREGKFKVRMRHGFFGRSDDEAQTKPRTVAQQLYGALTSPFGVNGVHIQLTSLFANDARFGTIIHSILHVDPRDLTFTDEPNHVHKCVFDVLSIMFGDNGVPIDQIGKTYTILLTDKQYERVQRQGLVYRVTIPIKKPAAYQLRLALRDSITERVGSATQFIEAPDLKKNRLALSGLVLRGETRGNKSASKEGADSGEGMDEGDPEASPALRHFKRGMILNYGYAIYNARVDKATGRTQLFNQVRLFRDGKLIFTGREIPFEPKDQTDMKRLGVGGALQLGTDMVPGEYVLQILVTDRFADQKHGVATQWMDFEIVK